MAQYDLFPDPAGTGYLLDVQSDLLAGLNVWAVVPFLPQERAPVAAQSPELNPDFEIDGEAHVMMTQYIAAVSRVLIRGQTSFGFVTFARHPC